MATKSQSWFLVKTIRTQSSGKSPRQRQIKVPLRTLQFMTVADVAFSYGIPESTVYSHVQRGLLPAFQKRKRCKILIEPKDAQKVYGRDVDR